MIIGICGPSGSGKSYYANKLKLKLQSSSRKHSVLVINMDNFYKGINQYNQSQLNSLNNKTINYDDPNIIDIDGLLKFIYNLKTYHTAVMPIYDFSLFDRLDEDKWSIINGHYDIIIIEGIFAFYYAKLRQLYGLKIYMNTPETICFERRVNRNLKSRKGPQGNNLDFEMDYYKKYAYPSYKKYIEPLKKYADIIL